MIILLTGATGFLGYRILEELARCNWCNKVIATGRTLKQSHRVEHPKIEYLLGELNDVSFVDRLFSTTPNIVIHAAALSSPWGKYKDFFNANYQSTEHLIQACQKFSVDKFIYISTPSLYFNGKDQWNIKESDPLPTKFVNHYAATKRAAEKRLEESGIPYISLRPRALTGRGDTVIMPRLIRAQEEGRLRIIGSGKNIVDLTPVSNVVDAVLLSIHARPEAWNEIYNIAGKQPVMLWEKISDILTMLDKEPPQKNISYRFVYVLAGMMEFISRLRGGKEPALTRYGVGTLAKSFTMDISKAKEKLGYEPKQTIDEAIDEFVTWYKNK